MPEFHAATNTVIEFALEAGRAYSDPYNDAEVDVLFSGPGGRTIRVPAFWSGDSTWRIRFAPPDVGEWSWRSECSKPGDPGLHGQTGTIVAREYGGPNALLRHGRIRISTDRRHFAHADGAPFLWLGDTWWMGLTRRLDWPTGFQELTADRVAKGFSVIQIIAGPYPDMDTWDPRGTNEAGYPFERDFARINPAWYDLADLKIAHLVRSGLVPCIVGMWGYYLPEIGVERIKRFWRNLVARYGAYPVVWCIAGEAAMAWYLSENRDADIAAQKKGWTEVCRHVQEIDGFDNPVTIHPTQYGRDQVEDPAVLDFDMLQTGHSDRDSVLNNGKSVLTAHAVQPTMPVVVGEVNYEGIMGRCWNDIQRQCFWTSILNGAAGHTYGANGIWQASTVEEPYGLSPHGRSWGNTPWTVAMRLPGSQQLGAARRLLLELPWERFETHHEWTQPAWDGTSHYRPCAAGIPREVRVIYSPMVWDPPLVKDIEPDVAYEAFYFDPVGFTRIPIGPVKADAEGTWRPPLPPEMHDWIIVMQAR